MANNDFLPWATGGGANVLTPAAYTALAERITGSVAGTAISADWNTAMRQSSFMAAAFAQWIANNGVNASDDGVLANMTGNINGLIRGGVVSTIAALRTRLKTGSSSCFVLGYYVAGDGGGGEYRYDSGDVTSVDNGGTIIVAADGGRWKLVTHSFLTPEQFGAKGDGTTDDTAAVNACFAAVAVLANQNTGDTTQRRKYLSVLCTKNYKLTAQVVVPAGVMVACEGGIFINALASTTTFCLVFSAGSHCFRLDVSAAGGSGIQLGTSGAYCDMIVGTVRVIGAGTTTSIIGCRVIGSRFEIEDIEVDGGFVGIDFGDGTTNGARLVNIDSLKSTLSATGVRFGSNCEHINLPNIIVDTPTTAGITIDGCRTIRAKGTVFGDDTRVSPPCSSGYAVIIGNTSTVNDVDFDLLINNTASTDNLIGTAVKISNCVQSLIKLSASRSTLSTGNAHRLKNAIEYGAGNSPSLSVLVIADSANLTVVGTQSGSLEFVGNISMVRLNTNGAGAAAYGSVNTAIRRFVNVVINQGPDITYADSATLGASFTINTPGIYAITHCDSYNTVQLNGGISLNSANLSTNINAIPPSECLALGSGNNGGNVNMASWVGYLPAGSIVRPHGFPTANTGIVPAQFTIVKIK